MNGTTYTIAQALASQLSNLQVVDSASDIAAALPNSALTARVAGFALSANGTLTAALADRLALLGGKFHTGGYLLTVSDTLAAMMSAANEAGLALAAGRQVVDAAYNLLAAPAGDFTHVTSVVLTGDPTLSVAQLARLEALPQFSIGAGAHVTLSDSLANINATLATHPGWFASLGAVTVRLDGSQIGAYAASQLEGLALHGKTVTFIPSGGDTALRVVAAAHDLASNAAALNLLAGHTPLAITLSPDPSTVDAADAAALTGLAGFNPAAHTLFVADSGASIAAHAASLFGHGFTEIIVTSGDFAGTAAQLLDPSLHLDGGATAMLTQSAVLGAAAAASLGALPGFSRAGGVALTVADTTADLLAHAGGLAAATAVQVTDSAVVSAAGAATLAMLAQAHPGAFSLVGHTLTVADTAANLLTLPVAALALAGATQLSADAAVTALQAATLMSEPDFSLGGHLLTVVDTATNLLALPPEILNIATATQLSADATLSATQAEALVSGPGFTTGGHALTISDTAANLLALPMGLQIQASALVLGAAQTVGAAQLTTLLSLGGKFSEAGHLLTVADSATSLAGLSAPALALAGAAVLTQSAVVSAAVAGVLADLPGFSEAPGVALTVQDSVANLLALAPAVQAIAAQELLQPGAVSLTAAQAAGLAALADFSAAGATIIVTGTVGSLTDEATAGWQTVASVTRVVDSAGTLAAYAGSGLLQHADSVTVSNNAQISAAQAASLATIPNLAAGAAQLTVLDGAAAIAAQQAAITSIGALAEINDSETVTAPLANALATLSNAGQLVFLAGHWLTVADTAAGLLALSPTAIALAGAVQLTANATVDAAGFLILRDTLHVAAGGHIVTISDTAQNLLGLAGGNLALAGACVLSGAATVSAAVAATLVSEPGFTTGGHLLTVAGSAADLLALAPGVLALAGATQLTASATVNEATASLLAALPGFSEAGGVTLTVRDDVAHLLAFTQAMQAITGVEELQGGAVTLTASQAAGLVALGHFSGAGTIITVSDNVAALTGGGNPGWSIIANITQVTDTAATLAADAGSLLLQNANAVTLSANASVSAGQAAMLASIPHFAAAAGQLTVVDGAAAIAAQAAAIVSLGALAEINDNETITVAQADTLAGLAQAGQLAFLGGDSLTVQGSFADLSSGGNAAGVALAGHLIVIDSAADVAAAAAYNWGPENPSCLLTSGGPISGAQAIALAGLGAQLNLGGQMLAVFDNAANVVASAGALSVLHIGATVLDSLSDISANAAALAALGNALTGIELEGPIVGSAAEVAALAPLAAKLGEFPLFVRDNAADVFANLPALETINAVAGTHLLIEIEDTAAAVGAHAAAFAASGAELFVWLTPEGPVSAAIGASLAPLAGHLEALGGLGIVDTGAAIAANAVSLAALGGTLDNVTLSDGWTQTAAVAAALAPLDNHFADGAQLTATGNVAQLASAMVGLAQLEADGRLAGVIDTLDNAADVASHNLMLNGLNATVTISDSAADVSAVLDQLAVLNHLIAVTLTDGGTPSLTLNVASLAGDGAVLAVITGPYQLDVVDSGAAISADLASPTSFIVAHAAQIGGIDSLGGIVSVTMAVVLSAGMDTNPGDLLTLYGGALDVTGVDVADLATIAGLPHPPTTIEMADTAALIQQDLTSDFPATMANLASITAIAVTDHGAITLTAAQALETSMDDGAGSVFSKITGATLAVTDCSLAQLPQIEALGVPPASISVSDTQADIAADLANPSSSVLIADLANIASIHITDGVVLSLTEAQALAPGVDDGAGSVLAKMSGGGFAVTGVAAGDIGEVLGLNVAPGQIGVSDTAQAIAANLATLVAVLGKITTITVSGGTLTLTATQAEAAGVADGANSVIGDIAGHAFDVGNVAVAQLAAVAGLAETPSGMKLSDSSVLIAADLASGNSAIVGALGLLTGIVVTGGTLTINATTALALIGAADMNAVALLLGSGQTLQVTGVALADLAAVAGIAASHLAIQVADSAANVVADLQSGGSLLLADSALVGGVSLTQGDTLSAAGLTTLAGCAGLTTNHVALVVSDNAAAIAGLGVAAQALATSVVVQDSATDVAAELSALQAVYGGHLSIVLTGGSPALTVNAATYSADQQTLDAITTPATVTVTGTAASIAPMEGALRFDAAVAQVDITDSAANVVANLTSLLALGPKLAVTLNDVTPLSVALLVPLLQIANLNTNGVGVSDTGSQLAATVESGNAAAINFMNTYGATLNANSDVAVAGIAALGQLIDFSRNGYQLVVWDTAAHLTAAGAATTLSSGQIDSIHLKTTNGAATLTAATTVALFAIAGFSPANPDGSGNLITVSDTAAHIDAVHAGLGAIGAGVVHIVVNASATITDTVLGDLQTLSAVAALGVQLTVRDTAANIDANAVAQASGQSITPMGWQLSASATVSEANAVVLGNLAHFSAGPYTLTLNINADTLISVSDANVLGNIGAALSLNGHHLLVDGTVAQLATLSVGALSLVVPQLTDSFADINALSVMSPLLSGTVTVNDAESVSAAQAAHFLGLVNGGSGPGINPANLSFAGHTESVVDSIASLQALTAGSGWTSTASLHASFQLNAADTVANLTNGASLVFLEGLHATALVGNDTASAASAETLANIASEIHFGLGGYTLTVSDSAANLLNSANADGLALATTLTLTGPDTVGAAAAETLLTTGNFVLNTELTISDSSANLLDGTLATVIADSPYAADIQVQLAGPETLDAPTAEALVSLPGFNDMRDLSIADSSSYLLDSANLTAEQMATSVTLAGDEIVSANTVLRLSEIPHFNASGGMLILASNDFADAATLKAVADLGSQFSDGGHSLTLTQNVLDLTPTEFAALASDGIVANGYLMSAELVPTSLVDADNTMSLTAKGVAGATVNIYGESGTLISATSEAHAGFTVSAADGGGGYAFSVTEVVNGTESAPVVVLEAGVLENAVTAAHTVFASSGEIEVAAGEYLNLYTAGSVPVLSAPALVYDPNAHTVSLDIPGQAAVTLITLGAATHPASLDISEIMVKHHG